MDKGQKIVTNKASAERGEKQLEPQDNLKNKLLLTTIKE